MRSARKNTFSRAAACLAASCLAVTLGIAAAAAAPAAAATRVTYIGAYAPSATAWKTANKEIGPLQTDKIFYGTGSPQPLPPSFTGSTCDKLRRDQPVCIIAYKTASKKTVQSFVASMPTHRSRPVIMVYWQEPELHLSPATFKTDFDLRSGWVRQAAKARGLSYVKVAMDAATSQYARQGSGAYKCEYLPAAKYVDYYLSDVYQRSKLTGLPGVQGFQRWATCTARKSKPRGIAEYGLDKCHGTTEPQRATTLGDDAAYLAKNFPNLVIWNYWWADTHTGACHDPKFPVKSPTATEWRKIEAGKVAS